MVAQPLTQHSPIRTRFSRTLREISSFPIRPNPPFCEITAFAAVGRSTGSITFGEQPKGIQSYPFAVTLSGIGPAVIDSLIDDRRFQRSG